MHGRRSCPSCGSGRGFVLSERDAEHLGAGRTHADLAAELDRLYPGAEALLLTLLCAPTRQHEHQGGVCESPGKIPIRPGWNTAAIERWRSGQGRSQHITAVARHITDGGNIG